MYRPSIALVALFAVAAIGASAPVSPRAAEPAAAPQIVEWLNQTATLSQTAKALDRPAAQGNSLGEIAAGARIDAIGVVAGGAWVQIELPNKAIAYIPRAALALPGSPPPSPAAAPPPPVAAKPAAAVALRPAASANATAVISGPVTEVPNATTLVVADHRIRLNGVDPGPPDVLAPFEDWLLHKAGALQCTPLAQTGRYTCRTTDGSDVAGTAVLSGVARVGEGATADYRKFENQARDAKRGLWKDL